MLKLWRQHCELHEALERNRKRLYRMAYAWCHDPDLADDLTQDTLSKALRSGAQLREAAAVDGW